MIANKELIKEIHQGNVDRGFWEERNSVEKCLVLIISELCEAVEAIRKNKYAKLSKDYTDVNFKQYFENNVKDSFEDEIADTYIRICDYVSFYDNLTDDELDINLIADDKVFVGRDDFEIIFKIIVIINTLYLNKLGEKETSYNREIMGVLWLLELYAKHKGFDLEEHIKQKLLYNSTRPYKHGKIC